MDKKLSIIIPVFNEERTLNSILNKILEVKLSDGIGKEMIIIDDCSTDNSNRLANEFILVNSGQDFIRIFRNNCNEGKGFSIQRGIK